MDYLDDLITQMHEKFGIAHKGAPRYLSGKEKSFRITCLREEIDEYEVASTMTDELDALTDLLVFTVGSFHRHGYPIRKAFEAVMAANMGKEIAGEASRSERDFSIDLVKPDGWTGPEETLAALLDERNG